MARIVNAVSGSGLRARFLRSSIWSSFSHVGSLAIRLGSNLILTRLLYPEAFGLMALITVFIVGLEMFSDVGISTSIQRSEKGDDIDFLNTAWTLQIIRGGILWLICYAIAGPAAQFYNEPFLAAALPIAGISLLIAAFNPTSIHTAARHLKLGRLSALEMASQLIGAVAAVILAWQLESPWALIFAVVIAALAKLFLTTLYLAGDRNRLRLEREAVSEILTFGVWIFLSTICAFLLIQGDKAILGKYLSPADLGIYHIGFYMATVPSGLAMVIAGKVLIPIYRERKPSASLENYRAVQKMRLALTGGLILLLVPFMFFGQAIIELLYDDRFLKSGAVVIVLACTHVPHLVLMTYETIALAEGDSRNFFVVQLIRAVVYVGLFWYGVEQAGLFGALAGQAAYYLVIFPAVIWLARKHKAWDPVHDFTWLSIGLSISFTALWVNWDVIQPLL